MSANETPALESDDSTDVPPAYEPVESYNHVERWVHEETRLSVELQRWSILTQMENPRTSRIDHYEYRLVVREHGLGGAGTCVDITKDADHARVMTREWLRAHPDGRVST